MNDMLKELALKGRVQLSYDEGGFQWVCRLSSTGNNIASYKLQYFASEPEDAVRAVWFMAKEMEEKPFNRITETFEHVYDEIPF